MGAHGNQLAIVFPMVPNKCPVAALFGQGESQLIILGQTVRIERTAAAPRSQIAQYGARYGAAHAGRRDAGPECGSHRHILAMGFGKLVAIMTGDPGRLRMRQRDDGNLHKIMAVYQPVEQLQFMPVNKVFGVRQDYGFIGQLALNLVRYHAVPQCV